jgi:hypothetical protein
VGELNKVFVVQTHGTVHRTSGKIPMKKISSSSEEFKSHVKQRTLKIVRFEVLTASSLKMTVFWVVALRSLVAV